MDLIKRNGFSLNPFLFIKLNSSHGEQLTYGPDAFISSLNYDSEDITPSGIK